MNKKVYAFLGALAVVLVAAAAAQSGNHFTAIGRLYAQNIQASQAMATPSETPFAVGDHFEISQAYYENTVTELCLSGHTKEDAEQLAKDLLVEKYCLYQAAADAGCLPSDDEVLSVIKKTREGIEVAKNSSDFYKFLDGTGMTEDEYWESQFENVKMYEAISNYQTYYYEIMNTPFSSNAADTGWDEIWSSHVAQIIADEHVVFSQTGS